MIGGPNGEATLLECKGKQEQKDQSKRAKEIKGDSKDKVCVYQSSKRHCDHSIEKGIEMESCIYSLNQLCRAESDVHLEKYLFDEFLDKQIIGKNVSWKFITIN